MSYAQFQLHIIYHLSLLASERGICHSFWDCIDPGPLGIIFIFKACRGLPPIRMCHDNFVRGCAVSVGVCLPKPVRTLVQFQDQLIVPPHEVGLPAVQLHRDQNLAKQQKCGKVNLCSTLDDPSMGHGLVIVQVQPSTICISHK